MLSSPTQAKVRAQFKDPRLRANVHWKDVNGARDMEAGPWFLMKSPTYTTLLPYFYPMHSYQFRSRQNPVSSLPAMLLSPCIMSPFRDGWPCESHPGGDPCWNPLRCRSHPTRGSGLESWCRGYGYLLCTTGPLRSSLIIASIWAWYL